MDLESCFDSTLRISTRIFICEVGSSDSFHEETTA